jgi:V8-like Glu-specific endopeptidase
MYTKMKYIAALLLLVLAFQLVGENAQAGSAFAGGSQVATKLVTATQQQAAMAFWTRDNIASAKPMGIMTDPGAAKVDAAALLAPEPFAMPGFAPAGMAAAGADKVAKAGYPEDWAASRQEVTGGFTDEAMPEGTSQTYTAYSVNSLAAVQKVYPHVWVGRLSFKTSGGTSYCSATAVSGNNIVTAAHCVYDTTNNIWYSNWVFSPAYRAGNAPYGTFTASACTILSAWVNLTGSFSINGWSKYDVAVCTMGKNSLGQTLNGAVGYMGRQWNYGYARSFFDMGYPFNDYKNLALPSAGYYLRTCVGESFMQTTDTRGIGCSYGPGISGGPWVTYYAQGAVSGYVDGVNSGLYIGTQNMYGPRFTSNNIVPLCTARGC